MSITVEADKAFFWSDLHLSHKAAAKARGYGDSLYNMNETLLSRAQFLEPTDTLFLLGDISFAKFEETQAMLSRIRCKKILVMGNHDAGLAKKLNQLFDEVHHLLTVKVVQYVPPTGKKETLARIVCCHYPILVWNDMHHGSWHLHGHSHGSVRYPSLGKVVDVGVDAAGRLGPLSYYAIKEVMDTRPLVSFDHHGQGTDEWSLT